MNRRLAVLVLAVLGCERAPALASPSCPEGDWRPARAPDASVALCLAPGFAPAGEGQRWARGEVPDADYAWLSLAVLDSAEAVQTWGRPPVPRSFRVPDPPDVLHAVRAESVTVHAERVDGEFVEIETALVSGGVTGFRRQPALRAVWRLPGGRWALAQGFAERAADLATLRAMLRTAKLAAAGSGSRPAT